MKMYSLTHVVFLALLLVVHVQSDKVCSVLEHREMQADFTNCSRRYTEEHFNTVNGNTCHLVKSVVGKCGELWERCHTSSEVRRMRDLHIEALVRQYGSEGGLEGCDLVQEYRQSGRTPDDPVEDVTCSDTKTMDIQTKFQTCSHATATSLYQTIQDLTSVKIITDKLCKALTTIGTVCVKHLNECFAEDDVRQMRKSHMEEMKTFLLRISQEKVTGGALNNCKVVEYAENEEDITDPIRQDKILPDIIENSEEEQKEEFLYSNSIEHGVEIIAEEKYVQDDADNIEIQGEIFVPDDISNITKDDNDKDITEVTTTEIKSSYPVTLEGGSSIDLIDVQSTTSIESEKTFTTENNKKDDAVTIPSDTEVGGKDTTLSKDTTEAGDEAAIGRVSNQKMVLPNRRESAQFIVDANGGGGKQKCEVLTSVIAVITSLWILVGIL